MLRKPSDVTLTARAKLLSATVQSWYKVYQRKPLSWYQQIGLLVLCGSLFAAVKIWDEVQKPGRLPLQEVRLTGMIHTPVAQAMAVTGVQKGDNLLSINLNRIQQQMESLPWIRSVRVKRKFPSTLLIRVVEKVAVGMGRKQDQLVLLDEYGMVIKPVEVQDTLVTPIVVPARGHNQAAQVVWLINLLAKHGWLRDRISEAVGLPGGRWTLYTKKGVKLLFSKQTDQEMRLLQRLQDQYAILDRKISQVELRIPGRAAVRSAL